MWCTIFVSFCVLPSARALTLFPYTTLFRSVGQPHRVAARTWRLLQRCNEPALAVGGDDPACAEAVVLGRVDARAKVADVSAEAGEVLAEAQPLSARRTNTVSIVVDRRKADE